MEEYQDFDKAVIALNEAKRCLHKCADDLSTRKHMETIDNKIVLLHKYIKARKSFENGLNEEAIEQCQELITEIHRYGGIVRMGDVYALMLKHTKDMLQAREL